MSSLDCYNWPLAGMSASIILPSPSCISQELQWYFQNTIRSFVQILPSKETQILHFLNLCTIPSPQFLTNSKISSQIGFPSVSQKCCVLSPKGTDTFHFLCWSPPPATFAYLQFTQPFLHSTLDLFPTVHALILVTPFLHDT